MRPEPRYTPEIPSLVDVLDTVQEFGSASLGLVAWDLWLSEEQLLPMWKDALEQRLLEPAGRCPDTAERMFSVAAPVKPEDGSTGTRAHATRGA